MQLKKFFLKQYANKKCVVGVFRKIFFFICEKYGPAIGYNFHQEKSRAQMNGGFEYSVHARKLLWKIGNLLWFKQYISEYWFVSWSQMKHTLNNKRQVVKNCKICCKVFDFSYFFININGIMSQEFHKLKKICGKKNHFFLAPQM